MNPIAMFFHPAPRPRACGWAVAVAAATLLFAAERAQAGPPGFKLVRPQAGGLLPHPVITSVSRTNNLTINWAGFLGPYTVERSQSLLPGSWQALGDPTTELTLTVPMDASMGFLRVSGPAAEYVGSDRCLLCHPEQHETWAQTKHAVAHQSLKNIGQGANAACLACHTVGYGFPTGFKDEATTPGMAGVQCENCHGPGKAHASKPSDLTKRPISTRAGMMCGGCHNDAHHPTYDEWETAGHAEVSAELVSGFLNTDVAAAQSRMRSCGACHSGAVRLAFLNGFVNAEDPVYPEGAEAAEIGITCAVCHDPHSKTANPGQLRNPLASMTPFSYSTSTNTSFAKQYGEGGKEVNLCGQCHNARGAQATDTSRPPHHSPQYNVLIGGIGVLNTNIAAVAPQSPHRDITTQCVHCHTHPHEVASPTEANPNFTGHDFKPHMTSCEPCHDAEEATLFTESTQEYTKSRIAQVKALLDQWGATKAPEALRTKYGILAWEYNNLGQLSTPTATVTRGPTATEQANVPQAIKEARFNLYLVEHDGSFGVHNGRYTRYLLKVAEDRVKTLLAQ
jgi:hypothetical protein